MQDTVMPNGAWAFDEGVTAVFDDMLTRSIPQYEVMRQAVHNLAVTYAKDKPGAIVDLGCSRGAQLAPLVAALPDARFIGVDVSEPMLSAAAERFKDAPQVEIRRCDLRHDFPTPSASVVLSVLTLQFTPLEYRQNIIQRCYNALAPGGALILVEKVLGSTADIDDVMVSQYYSLKAANGYSQDQIERKRYSLEGVLVPLTARWNEELLARAGFAHVDCFWRWMNFGGWIAVKQTTKGSNNA